MLSTAQLLPLIFAQRCWSTRTVQIRQFFITHTFPGSSVVWLHAIAVLLVFFLCRCSSIRFYPHHVDGKFLLGSIDANDRSTLAEAEDVFREIIQLEPRHSEARRNLCALLADQNKEQDAQLCLTDLSRTVSDRGHVMPLNWFCSSFTNSRQINSVGFFMYDCIRPIFHCASLNWRIAWALFDVEL